MATKKGTNPNSHEALRKATAARKKGAKQVHVTLSPEAIASLDRIATALGISRSELIERYGRNYHLIEAVLDAVEDVLYDGTSTEECLPPHPSYEVDGDVFRKLSSAFMRLMEAEKKG